MPTPDTVLLPDGQTSHRLNEHRKETTTAATRSEPTGTAAPYAARFCAQAVGTLAIATIAGASPRDDPQQTRPQTTGAQTKKDMTTRTAPPPMSRGTRDQIGLAPGFFQFTSDNKPHKYCNY
jgi:hypothetical protein